LHQKRILHRDIKARNIFLDSELNVKIGDLGLGRELGPASRFAYTAVGTPLYFSPEMCQEERYNEKCDVWALGCLIYEMSGKLFSFVSGCFKFLWCGVSLLIEMDSHRFCLFFIETCARLFFALLQH
jgi:serine/threonine protein kinase